MTPIASTVVRIIGLLAVAAALAGCSAIKLGYNNLRRGRYWWLDGYVDFDRGAGHACPRRPRPPAPLAPHRGTAPPGWPAAAAWKSWRPATSRLPRPALSSRRCASGCMRLLERAEPAIVALALGLGPDQLRHLERKYEKNNRDFRKDWLRLRPPELNDKRLRAVPGARRNDLRPARRAAAQRLAPADRAIRFRSADASWPNASAASRSPADPAPARRPAGGIRRGRAADARLARARPRSRRIPPTAACSRR